MKILAYLLTGGYLKNYRTYLLGFALAATGVGKYLAGDETLSDVVQSLPEILGGLGLVTLRAGLQSHMNLVKEVLAGLQAYAAMQGQSGVAPKPPPNQ
jgi:hypothetical protein